MLDEYLKYFTYYHLAVYSIPGLLLLVTGFKRRSKLIVDVSQVFLILPISGMLVHELIMFRDNEKVTIRLLASLFYSLVSIILSVVSKRKVASRAGFLVWILTLEFLFLSSISGYSYYKNKFTFDEKNNVATKAEKQKEREEALKYSQHIDIKFLNAESYKDIDEGQSIMVNGEIDNNASRVVNDLSIKVILFGGEKTPIYDEILHVVYEEKPLLPGKGIRFKFRLRKKPAAWAEGSYTYIIKSLKLGGHRQLSDFESN